MQVWVVSDGGWWLPRTYTLAMGGAGCGLTQGATTRGHHSGPLSHVKLGIDDILTAPNI